MQQQTIEYLQSERYAKQKKKTLYDIATAMENLKSADAATRLKGAKRLSYHSRRELGWNCLPVREWFFDEKSRTELSALCRDEADDKVLRYLLSTLKFIYDRYVVHFTWKELYAAEDETRYKKWVLSIVEEKFCTSVDVKVEVAGILSLCGDNRSWNTWNEVLAKKSAHCSWAQSIFAHHKNVSITDEQQSALIQTLEKINGKVKNPSVLKKAKKLKEIIENWENPGTPRNAD
ncbi:MAG: hypothetical protein FWG82_01845 [Oscillospiraceae bacterium]|nr:hypothetical protein [Oscillospiraceae bacterium]